MKILQKPITDPSAPVKGRSAAYTQVPSRCLGVCEHEFTNCMLYALDGFLMGACMEQKERCENACTIPPQKPDAETHES